MPSVSVRWQPRTSHGEAAVDAEVEHAVPELVQHRVRPVAIGRDIGQHAHVPSRSRSMQNACWLFPSRG